MDWITPQIAIGNFIDAGNVSEAEIDAILCLKAGCCDESDERFDILCLPLTDGSGNSIRDISDAIDFIDDVVSDGKKNTGSLPCWAIPFSLHSCTVFDDETSYDPGAGAG